MDLVGDSVASKEAENVFETGQEEDITTQTSN